MTEYHIHYWYWHCTTFQCYFTYFTFTLTLLFNKTFIAILQYGIKVAILLISYCKADHAGRHSQPRIN